MVWLDGYTVGDNKWLTYGYRDWDDNYNPTLMPDLSFDRTWFSEDVDTSYQVFNPNRRKFPVKLDIPEDFCAPDSSRVFILTAKLLTKGDTKSPQIIFKINKTTEVYHWDFRLGKVRLHDSSCNKYI